MLVVNKKPVNEIAINRVDGDSHYVLVVHTFKKNKTIALARSLSRDTNWFLECMGAVIYSKPEPSILFPTLRALLETYTNKKETNVYAFNSLKDMLVFAASVDLDSEDPI